MTVLQAGQLDNRASTPDMGSYIVCHQIACCLVGMRVAGHDTDINRLTPKYPYVGRTTPLTSKLCILHIYSINTGTEYFKHALYSPVFSLQNAVCFIMLICLVPVLFTIYIQGVLKFKK